MMREQKDCLLVSSKHMSWGLMPERGPTGTYGSTSTS